MQPKRVIFKAQTKEFVHGNVTFQHQTKDFYFVTLKLAGLPDHDILNVDGYYVYCMAIKIMCDHINIFVQHNIF